MIKVSNLNKYRIECINLVTLKYQIKFQNDNHENI